MALAIYQVDAFADRPFAGNPAGVCLLPRPGAAAEPCRFVPRPFGDATSADAARPCPFGDTAWMQDVAAEMNLSETAFLLREDDGFRLRWFTPTVEVELCGHATLASAHILWETGELRPDEQARFHTLSGLLTADRRGEWIELNFPAEPALAVAAPAGLIEALNVHPAFVGRNRMDYFVEVASEAAVRGLKPDMARLATYETRGVIVTARADDRRYDFVSRFFAPGAGVPEDPVTGSAHCALGPYWGAKLDRTELVGYQASRRGGVVHVLLAGERVRLQGQAVTVIVGELRA